MFDKNLSAKGRETLDGANRRVGGAVAQLILGCTAISRGNVPKNLDVDPADLRLSADHMDMHASELSTAHGAANADIEAAQAGWVGASASALQAKFAEWQEATTAMTKDIAAHGVAFASAAEGYTTVDQDGAQALDQQL